MELLIYKDRYKQYWTNKDSWITSTPGFAKVFTRDRFLAIWSMLYCVDERNPAVNKMDKIYKRRPIFDIIVANFQRNYVPACELSLDEGMIPTKNSLSIKQYIKDKSIKWGLKTFLLCESKTGYIMNAEVYTVNVDNSNLPAGLGVTGSLVARPCKPFEQRNHCIFTDRFYTPVTVGEYLLDKQGTGLCDTALPNRKKFPKEIINKKMERGSHSLLFNGKTAEVAWCDKKPIYFLTTKYISEPIVTVMRYDAKEYKHMPVTCPALVKAYNFCMSGLDIKDQMTKLQRFRRHYKWPRRLKIKFFVWCVFNSYVIQDYNKPHKQPGQRVYTFHMFIDKLCHDVVGAQCRTSTPKSTCKSGLNETRLQNEAMYIYLSNRKEQLQTTDVSSVVKSIIKQKEHSQRLETQTYQSAAKLCTGANHVRYFCVLAPVTKIVSKPTIQKFSTGDRLCFAINKKVCLLNNFTFEDKNIAFENLDKNCWGSSGRRRRLKGIHSRSDTNRTGAEGLYFYYPRLLHCLNQMLAVMLLSQHRVSSSKTVRPRAPCGARCIGHAVST